MPQKTQERLKISDIGNGDITHAWGNTQHLARAIFREIQRHLDELYVNPSEATVCNFAIHAGILAAESGHEGGLDQLKTKIEDMINSPFF